MRTLLLFAILSLAASADDGPTVCRCKPREVGDSGSRADWAGYGKGVRWHLSLDEAKAMAREQKKLVFTFHIVGDLDKEGC